MTTPSRRSKGQERILLVDDEKDVAFAGRKMLERLGYDVIVKMDGREALELFRAGPDRFDLIITDQAMPGMSGTELAKELTSIRADIPVILCTGFGNDPNGVLSPENREIAGIRELALKPLDRAELAGMIRRVLDNPRTAEVSIMADILIIDDDDLMCQTLSHVARRQGHEVTCVHTIGAGLETACRQPFDVVFLDVRMPDGNGLDILPSIKGAPSTPEIVIMTGFGDPQGAELAIKSGAWDYIEKGSSTKEITLSLERALEYRKQKRGDGESRSVVALKREDIVGNSPKLKACLDLVAQAAVSDASVLITGETGTGKELFARAVHHNSRRAGGNFVVVDCAALPETLIESLLFGHEKGAFTGAEQAREGLGPAGARRDAFSRRGGRAPPLHAEGFPAGPSGAPFPAGREPAGDRERFPAGGSDQPGPGPHGPAGQVP